METPPKRRELIQDPVVGVRYVRSLQVTPAQSHAMPGQSLFRLFWFFKTPGPLWKQAFNKNSRSALWLLLEGKACTSAALSRRLVGCAKDTTLRRQLTRPSSQVQASSFWCQQDATWVHSRRLCSAPQLREALIPRLMAAARTRK